MRVADAVYHCQSLVIATGGLSIPTMGASPFGYQVAEQFGIKIWPTRAGLVPFTLHQHDKEKIANLSGISVASVVSNDRISFQENSLITHRGLSGPAMLQLSSYWQPGEAININLIPEVELKNYLKNKQQQDPAMSLKRVLQSFIPKRLLEVLLDQKLLTQSLASMSHYAIDAVANQLQHWAIKPNGTEGYRTAEVTIGGVDCNAISSKTFAANSVKGLYFIGEVLDVTGWLGGYNFQWAWSSGWAAGQAV